MEGMLRVANAVVLDKLGEANLLLYAPTFALNEHEILARVGYSNSRKEGY